MSADIRGTVKAALSGKKRRKRRRRLGEYSVVREVGVGASGVVYLCEAPGKGRCAIKSIGKDLKPREMRRVAREILIMQQLKHPNIVELVEVLETSTKLHLVLEYMEGGEVYEYVDRMGPMNEAYAKLIVGQVASALGYCHANGVSHRDVKLQNILFADKEYMAVKLSDFGMSSMDVSDKSILATACGTPYYAAPEVTTGKGYKAFPVDVWSLGICLYALTVGKFPFEGPNVRAVLQAARTGRYPPPPNASPALVSLLQGMLNTDPSARLSISDVLSSEWLATPVARPLGGGQGADIGYSGESGAEASGVELGGGGVDDDDDDDLDDWILVDASPDGITCVDVGVVRASAVRARPRSNGGGGGGGGRGGGGGAGGGEPSSSVPVVITTARQGSISEVRGVGSYGAGTSPGMSHLSISSDSSSVAWTPSASEMGDAAFVGTPTVFASHQDVTTLFSSIDGVSVATLEGAPITLPDESLTAKELFDSISSCWTSDSDLDYVSDPEDDGHYGTGQDSDTSISLSEDTDLPPVPPEVQESDQSGVGSGAGSSGLSQLPTSHPMAPGPSDP